MFNYQFEMIAKQRQQEINQNSREAWKFSISKEISNMIKGNHPVIKTNNKLNTCEVCKIKSSQNKKENK
jgi:hypothetical protein